MSSKLLERSLRRLKPEKHVTRLRVRNSLLYLRDRELPLPKLLLDTTVYIDTLQGVQPAELNLALRAGDLWHCTVTEAELAALAGLLHPNAQGTADAVAQVAAVIDRRPAHRILKPDREIWREAGILAGLMARLQGFAKSEQRKALNDALIYLTAVKHGCAVLTRNAGDFDLLHQVDPRGSFLIYDRR